MISNDFGLDKKDEKAFLIEYIGICYPKSEVRTKIYESITGIDDFKLYEKYPFDELMEKFNLADEV